MKIEPSVIVITLLSGLLSGVTVAIINYLANEASKRRDRSLTQELKAKDIEQLDRSRKSDLFKTIYAEKFKAGQAIIETATNVFQMTTGQLITGSSEDKQNKQKIMEVANDLLGLSASSSWILGGEVKELAHQLAVAAKIAMVQEASNHTIVEDWLSDTPSHGGTGKYEKLLEHLAEAVREELHLNMLESLFRTASK